MFGSGTAAQTHAVTDPGAFAQSGQWIPIVVGVLVALVVSLTKSAVRPAANVATAGFAAPGLAFSTSDLTMRPRGPVPDRAEISRPFCVAMRRAELAAQSAAVTDWEIARYLEAL